MRHAICALTWRMFLVWWLKRHYNTEPQLHVTRILDVQSTIPLSALRPTPRRQCNEISVTDQFLLTQSSLRSQPAHCAGHTSKHTDSTHKPTYSVYGILLAAETRHSLRHLNTERPAAFITRSQASHYMGFLSCNWYESSLGEKIVCNLEQRLDWKSSWSSSACPGISWDRTVPYRIQRVHKHCSPYSVLK
jgi:hypothetical protein